MPHLKERILSGREAARWKIPAGCLAALILLSLAFPARAGDKEVVSSNAGASILTDSEKEDLGDVREDGGILSHFHATVQAQGDYTSNALLHGNHASSDFLLVPTVIVTFNQPLAKGLSFNALARSEEIIFSDHGAQDFWGFSGLATFDYRPGPQWPHVFAGVEPYWNTRFDNSGIVEAAYGITGGIDQGVAFDHGKCLLTAGYSFTSYFSEPSQDNRDTHRVLVALTRQFKPDFYGQFFYQFSFDDFRGQDRSDSRNAVGFNLVYQFSKRLFGSFTAAFVNNDSSVAVAHYQDVDVSTGLTLKF